MAALSGILLELDRLLEPQAFSDYCPNGLQVQGRSEIGRIATGVSASSELFERALTAGADLVIAHHGLFWDGEDVRVLGPRRERLRLLLSADVSLAAYHLPLDAHPTFGNNALIAKGLGATLDVAFAPVAGRAIGWCATFDGDGITPAELTERVTTLTARAPLTFLDGPERIRTIGIVSGGGARNVSDAIAAGLDAFLTGEPAEWARALAHESAIHFLAAGHHATETFGVRALGAHLAEHFGVEHLYIEIDNPV
jgi:dinuclear metal center YbgI/SA1388 family protein